MSYSKACCTIPPVQVDYTPIGTVESVKGFDVYVTGPKDANKAILVIYDIYGLHNNTKQFCDILAQQGGYKVVMPDFFRGKPWTFEKSGDREAMLSWIHSVGTIDKIIPDASLVCEWLQTQGVAGAGLVGFCWGAKIAIELAAVKPFFKGAATIHPSFVDVADARAAASPVLVIATRSEPDMTDYMELLYKKPFGANCQIHRFDDVEHGFCAARGDWTNETVKKRVNETFQLVITFFAGLLDTQ
ncbi:dienelactone hydrolase [Dichotomocladium elegans]|nr:dienelactone hydrolase [Dichotomocladium elegans]